MGFSENKLNVKLDVENRLLLDGDTVTGGTLFEFGVEISPAKPTPKLEVHCRENGKAVYPRVGPPEIVNDRPTVRFRIFLPIVGKFGKLEVLLLVRSGAQKVERKLSLNVTNPSNVTQPDSGRIDAASPVKSGENIDFIEGLSDLIAESKKDPRRSEKYADDPPAVEPAEPSRPLKTPTLEGASSTLPAFMIPCQIETRLFKDFLKVRVYPDQIAIDRLERHLTREENDDGLEFQAKSDLEEWKYLSGKYGPGRAAWIAKRAQEPLEGEKFRDKGKLVFPKMKLLPQYFVLGMYLDNGQVLHFRGVDISEDGLDTISIGDDGLFSDSAKWISDFDASVRAGMGFLIRRGDLGSAKVIEKLTVVGLRPDGFGGTSGSELLMQTIESHYYSDGADFLHHGTATNNTEESESGFTTEPEVEERFEREFGRGNVCGKNATDLASALGVNASLFCNWQNADCPSRAITENFHDAIWPATAGYFMNNFLKGVVQSEDQSMLREHFVKYVRPLGYLPTMRIGNVPYGVLPVTQLRPRLKSTPDAWESSAMDSNQLAGDANLWRRFDQQFHRIVISLAGDWLQASHSDNIPKVFGNENGLTIHEELVRILAMSPDSQSYLLRSFNESEFADIVIQIWYQFLVTQLASEFEEINDELFLEMYTSLNYNEEDVASDWLGMKVELAEKLDSYVARLTGNTSSSTTIYHSLLANLHTFGNFRRNPFPLVRANNSSDSPENYLAELAKSDPDPNFSKTLLYKLLYRSQRLTPAAELDPAKRSLFDAHLAGFLGKGDVASLASRANEDLKLELDHRDLLSLSESISSAKDALAGGRIANLSDIYTPVPKSPWQKLLNSLATDLGACDLEALLKGTMDVSSFRVDAWVSSLANKRLDSIRRQAGYEQGIVVGAYGIVENLALTDFTNEASHGGFIHAPSAAQATTAAILKNAFTSHEGSEENPYRFNISSDRIRRALAILQGMREGQDLGALLGYQFERILHDNNLDEYKDEFRRRFDFDQALPEDGDADGEDAKPRLVVNGHKLIAPDANFLSMIGRRSDETEQEHQARIRIVKRAVRQLRDVVDAISDLMMHEAVYQAVNGNYERSSAALDIASGNSFPREPESVSVPLPRVNAANRVCLMFGMNANITDPSPREAAEPKVAQWFSDLLGDLSGIGCSAQYRTSVTVETSSEDGSPISEIVFTDEELQVTLSDLEIKPIDFLYMSANRPGGGATELESRIKLHALQTVEDIYDDGTNTVTINFRSADMVALEDAVELGNQVLNTLGRFSYLKPEQLHKEMKMVGESVEAPIDPPNEPNFTFDNFEELYDRVNIANDALTELSEQFIDGVEPLARGARYLKTIIGVPDLVKALIKNSANSLPTVDGFSEGLSSFLLETFEGADEIVNDEFRTALGGLLDAEPQADEPSIIHFASNWVDGKLAAQLKVELNNTDSADSNLRLAIQHSDSLNDILAIVSDHQLSKLAPLLPQLRLYGFSIDFYESLTPAIVSVLRTTLIEHMKKVTTLFGVIPVPGPGVLSDSEADFAPKIEKLVASAKAIFGDSFIVLPRFSMPDPSDVSSALTSQDEVLKGQDRNRIYLWLQQVAQTHKNVEFMEDFLMFTDAWSRGDEAGFRPHVLALPFSDDCPWQALSNEELEISDNSCRPAGSLGLALFSNTDSLAGQVAGLQVEQWDETLPLEEVDTAIAFQANTPNQKPVNCCLLALASRRSEEDVAWNLLDLESIVCDTLTLAKIRSVDLDAMPPVHGLMPTIFMPKDDEQDEDDKEYEILPVQVESVDLPTVHSVGSGF